MLLDCLKKQKEILEKQGYSVAYISVYGSQNYNLQVYTDDYQSDIDMKAVIVPTLDDLIKDSKPISEVVDTEWGQCDVKDIRLYFNTLLKANPAYLETLFTDYHIVDDKFKDEFKEIFRMKDDLVYTLRASLMRALYGMMCEKEKALCHPYPSIAHKIEKWGWDGKQLSHQYRLWLFMNDYFRKELPFKVCLKPVDPSEVEFLIDLKLNKRLSLELAKTLSKDLLVLGKEFRDEVLRGIDEQTMDYSIKYRFLELSQSIIKNKIIEDCRKGDA